MTTVIEYTTNKAAVKVYNERGTEITNIKEAGTLLAVSGSIQTIGKAPNSRGSCYPISAPADGWVQVGNVKAKVVEIPDGNPPPVPQPVGFYKLLGDEFLAEYNYQSRTIPDSWGYLKETPCIFRYNPTPTTPTDFRTDVTWLEADIDRINGWTEADNHRAYYRSGGTAFFNAPPPATKYPKKLNATMANNVLEPVAIEGKYLKFKTIKPGQSVSHMTVQSHPQFVHKWDIIKGVKIGSQWVTQHKDTPHGAMYYFLVSNSGVGYIPLKNVIKL